MNTRQLNQGMLPTIEFERAHTFKSLRHFPELRMSMREIESMKTKRASNLERRPPTLNISRQVHTRSTHKLDELSRSSLDEIGSSMSDFRRILLENRKKNQVLLPGERPPQSCATEDAASYSSSSMLQRSGSSEFTGDPLSIANKKLAKVSVSFDALSYNSHLAGFAGRKLTKEEFHTQLRRCINVNLKRAELDELFRQMDEDFSGLIDGVEFVRYFFHLGNEARWKKFIDTKHSSERRLLEQQRRRREEQERVRKWEEDQIADFSPQDYESAMHKLAAAAFRFDATSYVDSVAVTGFEAFLTPYEFKMQIERSFNLKMTAAEMGSLVSSFTTKKGEFCVDGHLFLKKFRSLQGLGQENHEKLQVINRMAKERVMQMGQNTDILPRILGR